MYYVPIPCGVAILALVAFGVVLVVRKTWSVNLLSTVCVTSLVISTSALFLAGFARDDTELVAVVASDGRVTYGPAPDPTYADNDPGMLGSINRLID